MSNSHPPTAPVITSPSNPRVKELVSLRKRRNRDSEGVWVVEGFAELRLALDAGVRPRTLYYCPTLVNEPRQLELLHDKAVRDSHVVSLARSAFERASLRESPDGWIGVIPALPADLGSVQLSDRPLVLVCESVEKPGNLGAMLRTADAVAADAVIAAAPKTDWGNPNVVRASKGAVFAVPVASAPSEEVAAWLVEGRLQIVAADPDAADVVSDLDLTRPTAIIVGAEHAGLSGVWSGPGVTTARLPMSGRVDSLNVSTAAAVTLYEAVRQRGRINAHL